MVEVVSKNRMTGEKNLTTTSFSTWRRLTKQAHGDSRLSYRKQTKKSVLIKAAIHRQQRLSEKIRCERCAAFFYD